MKKTSIAFMMAAAVAAAAATGTMAEEQKRNPCAGVNTDPFTRNGTAHKQPAEEERPQGCSIFFAQIIGLYKPEHEEIRKQDK